MEQRRIWKATGKCLAQSLRFKGDPKKGDVKKQEEILLFFPIYSSSKNFVSVIHQTFFHTLFFSPPDLTSILITLRNNLCFRCELSVHTPQQERKKYLTLLYEPLVSVF